MNPLDKEKQNPTPEQQSESPDAVSANTKEKETDHVTLATSDMLNLLDEQIADDATEKKIRKELLSLKDKMKKEGMTADVQKEYASLQHKLLEAQHDAKKHEREIEKDDDKDSDKDSDPKDSGKKSRRGKIKDKARGHIQTAAMWGVGLWVAKKAFGYAKDRIASSADATAKGGMREGWKSFFAVKTKENSANNTADNTPTDAHDAKNTQNQDAQNLETASTADAAGSTDAPETNNTQDHPTLDGSPEAIALSQEQADKAAQSEADTMTEDEKNVTAQVDDEHKKNPQTPPIISILRMYQRGYMPKRLGISGFADAPIGKAGRMIFKKIDSFPFKMNERHETMTRIMTTSKDALAQQKALLLTTNPTAVASIASYEKQLAAIESDVANGTIKNMADLKAKHGTIVESRDTGLFGKMKKVTSGVEAQKKNIETMRKDIDAHAKEIDGLNADAKKKLGEFDAAIKADPKKAVTLRKEAEAIIAESNKKILHLETMTGADLAHLKITDAKAYEEIMKSSPLAKKLAIVNDEFRAVSGLEKGVLKKGTGAVKIIVGVSLMFLSTEGLGDLNWKDGADIGIGIIPVAGDVYDISMALYGKDLNGRDMPPADRWVRGLTGAGCLVANVFTFGIAGTAVKAGLKATTTTAKVVKATTKVGAKALEKIGLESIVVAAKGVELSAGALKALKGVRVASQVLPFAYLGYSLTVDHPQPVEQVVDGSKRALDAAQTEAKVATTSKVEI